MDYQGARNANSLPSMSRTQAIELLGEFEQPHYYAWPESFGSTSGPFRGIGGQAITTFTIEAWAGETEALYVCNGKLVKRVPIDEFKPGETPK